MTPEQTTYLVKVAAGGCSTAATGKTSCRGLFGNDEFFGDAGIDAVNYFYAQYTGGVKISLNDKADDLGIFIDGDRDNVHSDIRQKIFGGLGDDTITGSAADNTISGNAGNDLLLGLGGNDVFINVNNSADQSDTVDGGAGNDFVQQDSSDFILNTELTYELVSGGGSGFGPSASVANAAPAAGAVGAVATAVVNNGQLTITGTNNVDGIRSPNQQTIHGRRSGNARRLQRRAKSSHHRSRGKRHQPSGRQRNQSRFRPDNDSRWRWKRRSPGATVPATSAAG